MHASDTKVHTKLLLFRLYQLQIVTFGISVY